MHMPQIAFDIQDEDYYPRLFPQASRSIMEFAEQEVILPKGPRKGAYFTLDFMPFMRFIFDAMQSTRWRKVAIVGPTQSGKSLVANNIPMLYTLFELNEDIIVGIPNMDLAKGIWMEKILPVINATRYRELLPTTGAGARGGVPTAMQLKNGATLRFIGAGGGDAQKSSHTARVIIMTEVDKMDDCGDASEESDPVSQIEMRADAFPQTSKIILECTVTHEGGRIWQEAMLHGTGSRAWVPCPVCGRFQELTQTGLVFDATDALTAEDTARYQCQHCPALWDDAMRRQALQTPRLVHRGQEILEDGTLFGEDPRTRTFGFHYSVLYSPIQTIGKTAAQQFEADASEYQEKKKAMIQSKWALPWREDMNQSSTLSFSFLRQRAMQSQVELKTVPAWSEFIVFTVDVQKRWMYWHADAYKRDGSSQVIEYGVTDIVDESDRAIAKALDQTADIASEGWEQTGDPDTILRPRLCLLDIGYRYDIIAPWLRNRTGWFGCKGRARGNKIGAIGGKAIFNIPGILTIKIQDDGNKIWFIDVDATKALVHDRYFLGQGQPGYTEVPRDITTGYMASIASEKREYDSSGDGFVWVKIRRRNDYLDCRSYGVAAHMYLAQLARRGEDQTDARAKQHETPTERPRPQYLLPESARKAKQPRPPGVVGGGWLGASGRHFS